MYKVQQRLDITYVGSRHREATGGESCSDEMYVLTGSRYGEDAYSTKC